MSDLATIANIERFNTAVAPRLPADCENCVEWLIERGFFKAPASTKYHGAQEGGLFDHSFEVMCALVSLTRQNDLKWERPESPYLIGIFHDLCKIDSYYSEDYGQTFQYNTDTLLKGHGEKSVMLLSTLTRLTEEEVACIRYHMGAFTDKEQWSDYTRAIHRYPNVLWTHHADMIVTHIMDI